MKRILAAVLVAGGALAAAPTFANDVESVIPATPAGVSAPAIASTGVPAYGFGNADITSAIPELPLAAYASIGAGYVLAHASPFGSPDITCTMQ